MKIISFCRIGYLEKVCITSVSVCVSSLCFVCRAPCGAKFTVSREAINQAGLELGHRTPCDAKFMVYCEPGHREFSTSWCPGTQIEVGNTNRG